MGEPRHAFADDLGGSASLAAGGAIFQWPATHPNSWLTYSTVKKARIQRWYLGLIYYLGIMAGDGILQGSAGACMGPQVMPWGAGMHLKGGGPQSPTRDSH